MPPAATLLALEPRQLAATHAVAEAARLGLTATPKSLPPWLFYDEPGSELFEAITALPEYYLTRTERALFTAHASEIFHILGCPISRRDGAASNGAIPISPPRSLTVVELGAGTASKTGILLRALTRRQPATSGRSQGSAPHVLYQPIDISPTALDEARTQLEAAIPGLTVRPRVANYTADSFHIERPPHARILALYIGSSIGNFSPEEARAILARLRSQLVPGDALLLGTDLAPSANGHGKSVATLLAAYNDAAGVTAAFNRNILAHLNRDLGADFRPDRFLHRAHWNPAHSRIEIYLESFADQVVRIPANSAGPALTLRFAAGETIHTENSYKFTREAIASLLADTGFTVLRTFTDPEDLFAITLAAASQA